MYSGSSEGVVFPTLISMSRSSALLLKEMAEDMEISLDELISNIAEDSVADLGMRSDLNCLSVPDSFTRKQLLDLLGQ
tara:strand:- start:772 stop:1005 length:234 start_codon:yes stop_codon:yes gene_type:complete